MIHNTPFNPDKDVIPLRFEYDGIRVFGYAKGNLEGTDCFFEVFSGIGNFTLQAHEKSPSNYNWTSRNNFFPRKEIIKMIGLRIESFFRNLKKGNNNP